VNHLKEKCTNCDRLELNSILVLFGNDGKTATDKGFNHILLAAKFFIYKCRINIVKSRLDIFLQELTNIHKTDQYVFKMNMKQEAFVKKWLAYLQFLLPN
jgi:hypothetical protein